MYAVAGLSNDDIIFGTSGLSCAAHEGYCEDAILGKFVWTSSLETTCTPHDYQVLYE